MFRLLFVISLITALFTTQIAAWTHLALHHQVVSSEEVESRTAVCQCHHHCHSSNAGSEAGRYEDPQSSQEVPHDTNSCTICKFVNQQSDRPQEIVAFVVDDMVAELQDCRDRSILLPEGTRALSTRAPPTCA